MTRVRVLREAAEELRAIIQYYEGQQLGLGRAFADDEVRWTQLRIQERPLVSRIERGEVRVRTVARFPYRIYYRARETEILIVAVAHRRRRPGFWRERV
jgi:hypothetical protein